MWSPAPDWGGRSGGLRGHLGRTLRPSFRGCWSSLLCLALLSPVSAEQGVRVAGIKPPKLRPDLLTLILTVTATPSNVNFALVSGGVAAGNTPISITTGCVLSLGVPTQFSLYGYFASASAALSGGSPVTNIPTSAVLGKVPTGSPTTFTAFTQSGGGGIGTAGGSLRAT